jgi:hypothetical protein
MIQEHHQKALDDFVASVAAMDTFQAVILSGSIAKGTATATSDLDVYLVVSEDEYAARRARHDLAVLAPCDYAGGYVDGKVISLGVLEAAAERGSEPMRSSFTGSSVVHSTIGDIQPLVDRIAVYPEPNRARNMRDFYSQFALNAAYFGPQAMKRSDSFLLAQSLSNVVLYAGRLLLAYNRVLFPCPKQLLATVATCSHKPEGFLELTEALLREPSPEALANYQTLVSAFTDWGLPDAELLTVFLELDEWRWLEHEPPLAQR